MSTVRLQGSLASEGKAVARTLMSPVLVIGREDEAAGTERRMLRDHSRALIAHKGVAMKGLRSPVTRRGRGGGLTLPQRSVIITKTNNERIVVVIEISLP